jgi:hypothetical protein
MSNVVTLAQLKARALDYADMTGSDFVVDARLLDYINSVASELYDLLVNTNEDWFLDTHTVTLVSGTDAYELPSNYYKLIKAFWVSGGRRHNIKQFMLSELGGSSQNPLQGGAVELWYVPQMLLFSADDDTIGSVYAGDGTIDEPTPIPPLVRGWEDYVALGAAIKLLNREESDSSALLREQTGIGKRIIALAEPRDTGEPQRIQDVTSYGGNMLHDVPYSLSYRVMGSKIRFCQYTVGV